MHSSAYYIQHMVSKMAQPVPFETHIASKSPRLRARVTSLTLDLPFLSVERLAFDLSFATFLVTFD